MITTVILLDKSFATFSWTFGSFFFDILLACLIFFVFLYETFEYLETVLFFEFCFFCDGFRGWERAESDVG